MAVVKVDNGIVLGCQLVNLVQLSNDAVHGKDAVRGNQLHARSGGVRFLELGFQVCHVVVGITEALGFAEAHAVNNGSVVQGIGNNSVVCSQEAFKQPAVGVKAGGKQNRVFRAEKLGKTFFQLTVKGLRAADKTHGRHAETPLVDGFLGGFHHFRIISKAQIIIGAHVDDGASVLQRHLGVLLGGDKAFFLVKSFRTQSVQGGSEDVFEFGGIHVE